MCLPNYKTHNLSAKVSRDCRAIDLIIIDQGLQCANCSAYTEDHGLTWKNPRTENEKGQ